MTGDRSFRVRPRLTAACAFAALWLLQSSCGTIVGNPKKPPTDSGIVNPVVYQLPLIDFTVPDSAINDDEGSLNLAQDNGQGSEASQKTVLLTWARRLDRTVREINRLSERINSIAQSERAVSAGDTLTFKGKGPQKKISAKIRPLQDESGYSHEAVLCSTEKVVSHVRWDEAGKKMEVTRDFSERVEDGDSGAGVVTKLVLETTDGLTMDLATYGALAGDLPGEAGKGFAEKAVISRDANGRITVKVVADHFDAPPAAGAFGADYYLTGRMTPDEASGGKPFAQTFVAYYSGFKLLCKGGFDEGASDLWQPSPAGPRFCLGRPLGRKKFEDFADFVATVSALEEVGIVSKNELAPVALSEGLSCE